MATSGCEIRKRARGTKVSGGAEDFARPLLGGEWARISRDWRARMTVWTGVAPRQAGFLPPMFRHAFSCHSGAMARATPTPQTRMTLLKHKRELVKRARKIAAKGGFAGFEDVRQQFDPNEAAT